MKIVLERIDFYNEEIGTEGEDYVSIVPNYVVIDYNEKIGNEWLRGELRDVPYNYYVNLGHKGLIEKIKERLQQREPV